MSPVSVGDEEGPYRSFQLLYNEESEETSNSDGRRRVWFEAGVGEVESPGIYPDNAIKTSKYSAWDFLPMNLWEQLHKFGNAYFLAISVLMYIGEKTPLFVGTIKAFSTLATLMVMMSVTALMSWIDDQRRKESDRETNGQLAETPDGTVSWSSIQVGTFLIVGQDQEVPADLVVFCSSDDQGNCYVSTANLDGETSLKLKTAPAVTQEALSRGGRVAHPDAEVVKRRLLQIKGFVDAEEPTTSIHEFQGLLQVTELEGTAAAEEVPLSFKAILLRGTVVRNTQFVVGVVVYTGSQTRMVMNSKPSSMKQSNLERITNLAMQVILTAQLLLAAFTVALRMTSSWWQGMDFGSLWYLYLPDILLWEPLGYLLTYFVLYSNLMPISLYPTMEVCNFAQSYYIKNDIRMYWEDPDDSAQAFAARARSSNLCQELGQVSYLFSDKTGTLTRNIMKLKKVAVGGETYGSLAEGGADFDPGAKLYDDWKQGRLMQQHDDFWETVSIAHTVVVSTARGGTEQKYEAESPDESALVEASRAVGYEFAGRAGETLTLRVNSGSRIKDRRYRVLAVNAFDSTRKRMSAVVQRESDSTYHLLVKGADNVMLPLIDWSKPGWTRDGVNQVLTDFASEGLRTLVVARRQLEAEEVRSWLATQQQAERSMLNREGMLADAAEKIEADLVLAGVTAIEDKLQDGVPEAIRKLQRAGIKVWVLTGDKLETAINIGYSSQVLQRDMELQLVDADSTSTGSLQAVARRISDAGRERRSAALVLTGAALSQISADEEKKLVFLHEIATKCSVVIACRVSPLQKAEMVRLVREGVVPTPVTAAVGDGANDVPMIQEAQVGLGIAGREGRQAVNNSDFAIGQFRFLERLLLVHGRWNYRRACKFTLYTFWRNAVQVLMTFMYTVGFAGFSGTSLIEDWIRLSFNFLCSFPIMATGCLDVDVSDKRVLENPELYEVGREGRDLNPARTRGTLYLAVVHAAILFAFTAAAFPSLDLSGSGDYYTFGTIAYSCLLVDMNYRVMFLSSNWNKYTVGSVLLSFILYAVYLYIYPSTRWISNLLEPNMYRVPMNMVFQPTFWVCIICIPAMAMMVDVTISFLYWRIKPERRDLLRGDHPSDEQREPRPSLFDQPLNRGKEAEVLEAALDKSPFAQQRLPEWLRPKPSLKFVLLFGMLAGSILLGCCALMLGDSRSARQVRILYHGETQTMTGTFSFFSGFPWGTRDEEVFTHGSCSSEDGPQDGSERTCIFDVVLPSDMRAKARPLMLYYAVGPFHQNYYDYLKSEVPGELMGSKASASQRAAKCVVPTRKRLGREVVPCGMKAMSFFNDSFSIEGISIDETNIAWPSDKERYHNADDYGDARKSWLYDIYNSTIKHEEGVKNEHFLVWMRPSALPRVWNPYGWVRQELQKGQKLRVKIHDRFPVTWQSGYKELVLTELNFIGGRHHLFGLTLGLGGIACILCCVLVLVVECYLRCFSDTVLSPPQE